MPLDTAAAAVAANELFVARRDFRKIEALPVTCRPVSVADGYAVQGSLVAQMLAGGARRTGYKIGATNPAARAMLETDAPFSAVLVSDFCHASPAVLQASEYHVIILEAEIALRLGTDLPASGAPYTVDSVAAAVDAVAPAIEVVTSPFPVWNKAGIGSIIADNGANGCWIHGGYRRDWHNLDLVDLAVSLNINNSVVCEGAGRNVDGGPLIGLAWLANFLAASGVDLKAGEMVTTGSTTTPFPGEAGQEVVADFGPLGQCCLTIV